MSEEFDKTFTDQFRTGTLDVRSLLELVRNKRDLLLFAATLDSTYPLSWPNQLILAIRHSINEDQSLPDPQEVLTGETASLIVIAGLSVLDSFPSYFPNDGIVLQLTNQLNELLK